MSSGTSPSFGRCSSLAANIAWKVAGGGGKRKRRRGGKVLVRLRRRKQGEVCGDGDCAGWKKLPSFEARGVYNRRPEERWGGERRGTETNRETQGGWRGGLGDCVRARQSEERRVQTRSGHGTSCCARSIERSNHLCSHTMLAMANKLVYVCLRVHNIVS